MQNKREHGLINSRKINNKTTQTQMIRKGLLLAMPVIFAVAVGSVNVDASHREVREAFKKKGLLKDDNKKVDENELVSEVTRSLPVLAANCINEFNKRGREIITAAEGKIKMNKSSLSSNVSFIKRTAENFFAEMEKLAKKDFKVDNLKITVGEAIGILLNTTDSAALGLVNGYGEYCSVVSKAKEIIDSYEQVPEEFSKKVDKAKESIKDSTKLDEINRLERLVRQCAADNKSRNFSEEVKILNLHAGKNLTTTTITNSDLSVINRYYEDFKRNVQQAGLRQQHAIQQQQQQQQHSSPPPPAPPVIPVSQSSSPPPSPGARFQLPQGTSKAPQVRINVPIVETKRENPSGTIKVPSRFSLSVNVPIVETKRENPNGTVKVPSRFSLSVSSSGGVINNKGTSTSSPSGTNAPLSLEQGGRYSPVPSLPINMPSKLPPIVIQNKTIVPRGNPNTFTSPSPSFTSRPGTGAGTSNEPKPLSPGGQGGRYSPPPTNMPETEGRVPTPPPLPEPKHGAEAGIQKDAILDLGKRGNLLAEIKQGFKLKETGFKPK